MPQTDALSQSDPRSRTDSRSRSGPWRDVAAADALIGLSGLLEHCVVDERRADFVSWGFFRPHPWRNYLHQHSFYEVCLAYAGTGVFRHGDDEVAVTAGEVFLARPGVLHEIESTGDDGLGIAFWGFTLAPPVAPDPGGWSSGLESGPVVSSRTGSLPALVSALAEEARRPQSGYGPLCAALGSALVVETARAFTMPENLRVRPPRTDRTSAVVATMRRHLEDNLERSVTVRDVAAAVHLSERHAERLFAEATGASMMSTLRRLRLDHAATLLREGATSTAAVARACGYPDPGSFATAFRRHHGQPPQAFRSNGGTVHVPRRPPLPA